MSRHTPIKGKLTRSFGVTEGEEDMVVELSDKGNVSFRLEPVFRRLKRGEKLPCVEYDVGEVLSDLGAASKAAPENYETVKQLLTKIADKVPIAKFEGDNPAKAAYNMKVWLIEELKQTIEKQ